MFTTDKNGNQHEVKVIDGFRFIYCEMTEDYAICTIATGIEMLDGELIGAMADVESFGCHTVDLTDAMDVINQENGTKIGVKVSKHGKEYQSIRGDLWTVSKNRKTRFDNTVEKKTFDGKIGVAELARRAAAGEKLFDDSEFDTDTKGDDE